LHSTLELAHRQLNAHRDICTITRTDGSVGRRGQRAGGEGWGKQLFAAMCTYLYLSISVRLALTF